MIARFRRWLREILISIDQLLHVLFGGPKYLLRGGPVPSTDETLSSKVGRRAIAGARWALIAEWVIDWLFVQLGEVPDHCQRMIEVRCDERGR